MAGRAELVARARVWHRARSLLGTAAVFPGALLVFLCHAARALYAGAPEAPPAHAEGSAVGAVGPFLGVYDATFCTAFLGCAIACGALLLAAGTSHLLLGSALASSREAQEVLGQLEQEDEEEEQQEAAAILPLLELPWWRAELRGAHLVMWALLASGVSCALGWWLPQPGVVYYLDWLAGAAFTAKFMLPFVLLAATSRTAIQDSNRSTGYTLLRVYHRWWSGWGLPVAVAVLAPLVCAWVCR
jgi:hypothetical protein